MTALLLLRHGESTWNAERRWQGWADAPLSALGQRQAVDAAAHLGGAGLQAAVSSDLQRARRTAELLCEHLAIELLSADPGLRERNVGAWTGLTSAEIEARWPDALAAHRSGRLVRQPDGEDTESVVTRAVEALHRLVEAGGVERLLVVTHGGVIRALERMHGAEPPPVTPNLGGRWFTWRAGELEPGEAVMPVDAKLTTAPPSR